MRKREDSVKCVSEHLNAYRLDSSGSARDQRWALVNTVLNLRVL
jgi:hypothetical protein